MDTCGRSGNPRPLTAKPDPISGSSGFLERTFHTDWAFGLSLSGGRSAARQVWFRPKSGHESHSQECQKRRERSYRDE